MNSLGLAATFVAAGLLAGRLLGFVRELVLAHQFGASIEMDALVLAMAIPDGMTNMVLSGPLAIAIVPVLARHATEDSNDRFDSIAWPLWRIGAVISVLVAAIGLLAAPFLIRFLTPGLDPKTTTIATACLRVAFLAVPFTGAALIASPILQARRSFGAPAAATFVFNLALVVSILLLAPRYGVVGVVWGAVIASLLRAALLHHVVRSFIRQPTTLSMTEEHWRLLSLIPIAIVVSSLRDTYFLIDRAFVAYFPTGGISALAFADRLTQVPLGLAAGVAASSLLPFMALSATRENKRTTGLYTRAGVTFAVICLLPAAVAFTLLSKPLVSSVFMRGAFGVDAVHMTSTVLSILALSMPFQGISAVLTAAMFVTRRQNAVLYVSLGSIALHALVNWIIVPSLGYVGVAVSITLCHVVHAFALAAAMSTRFDFMSAADAGDSVRVGIVTGFTAVLVGFMTHSLLPLLEFSQLTTLVVGLITTVAAFAVGMYILFPVARTATALRARLLPVDP